jgi:hypothetical protein
MPRQVTFASWWRDSEPAFGVTGPPCLAARSGAPFGARVLNSPGRAGSQDRDANMDARQPRAKAVPDHRRNRRAPTR